MRSPTTMGRTLPMPELAKRSGVPARTLRSWMRVKAMPRPLGRGRAARYTEDHLLCAQAIQQLRMKRLSFREIAERLRNLSRAELAALVAPPVQPMPPVVDVPETTRAKLRYDPRSWVIVQVRSGFVLMVRPDVDPALLGIVEEIHRTYA